MHTYIFKSTSYYYEPYVTFSDRIFFRYFLSLRTNSGSNTIYIQLTFEQHGFELCRSSYSQIFSINTYTIFDPQMGIYGCGGSTVCHSIESLTSVDFGMHGGPGTNPLRIIRDNSAFWGVKTYTGIFNCTRGQRP